MNSARSLLADFTSAFAAGMKAVDDTSPRASNSRSGAAFQPGIGPHSESQTIALVVAHLRDTYPERFSNIEREVRYPNSPRNKCDIRLSFADENWIVEAKMLRLMGDNGKPNDNILMHILSPYSRHRSAVTDCEKLLSSGFDERKGIVIFGYEYHQFPMEPVIAAFELLARSTVRLSERIEYTVDGLIHPVHRSGRVCAWEISR